MQHDLTHARLAANALWDALRHNRWRGNTTTRRCSDHSGTAGRFRSIATANIPRARSMDDTIRQGHGHAIAATIHPDERAGNPTTYLVLERTAYDNALATHPTVAREDWRLALRETPPNLKPYSWARDGRPNANGDRAWYLCKTWDPYLTLHVYAVLHALAETATSWQHEDGQPRLIDDHEVGVSSREPLASTT